MLTRARVYWASDSRRAIQTVLGIIWLLDGALQFQSFMYSNGFIQLLADNASGQPGWLASTINWAVPIARHNLPMLNTSAALIQLLIGLGLLCRRTVRPALVVSFVWTLNVWWIGEGFGFLFANTANPLTGAPGAVVLYAIIGLLVWPSQRPGGLLGVRGARITWAILWIVMAWLWLLAPNSSANATYSAISAAPSGASWLSSLEHSAATAATGNGLAIALILAFLSAAIGVAVAVNWQPKTFFVLAIILSLAYWVIGQGFGGIFTGTGTDPDSGPLLILLAVGLYSLAPIQPLGDSK